MPIRSLKGTPPNDISAWQNNNKFRFIEQLVKWYAPLAPLTCEGGGFGKAKTGGEPVISKETPPVTAYGGDSPLINAGAKIR